MLGNKLVPFINPNGVRGGFDRERFADILKRNAVESTVVLDVEISPDGNGFLAVGSIFYNRKRQQRRLLLLFKDGSP